MKFNRFLLFVLLIPWQLFSQGINNFWCLGYANPFGTPAGGFDMNFISGSLIINTKNRQINYGDISATICDSSGQMLFSSNGVYVANGLGDS